MYVAFDIEVSKWDEDELMPISCAALAFDPPLDDGTRTMVWGYGDFMPPVLCRSFARALLFHAMTRRVITWNGLAFDFRILTEWVSKSTLDRLVWRGALENLAMEHIDPGFLMLCQRGYMIGLDTCAKALHVKGKLPGMSGKYAPVLWTGLTGNEDDETREAVEQIGLTPGSEEARELCRAYVQQDALATVNTYVALKSAPSVQWTTRAGRPARYPWVPIKYNEDEPLSGDLLTVRDAISLPRPNTRGLSSPMKKEDCYAWI